MCGPIALALPALALLIGLGTWQMQRKAWKEDLIAQITARIHQPPVAVRRAGEAHAAVSNMRAPASAARSAMIASNSCGSRIRARAPAITSIRRCGSTTGRFILVNRGYVTEAKKAPAARPGRSAQRRGRGVGLLREPVARAMFSPDHDARTGVWYWRDVDGMTKAALGADAGKAVRIILDAEATPANPGGWPQGGVTRLTLPNRHLEYALTWYGLALTLVGVLAAFIISRWRAA